ncbi:MAG TPA: MBOAT family O-acyltransferase [Thermoanaerobaculia bacterium]|nr:MBOAT family O-acyltransferase [Thermoanaerobaculia bacterium]
MVFSSHLFVFWFLPLVLLFYYGLPRRARHLMLTLMSYVFYGWANPAFVYLMLVSTLIDYITGLDIVRHGPTEPGGPRTRRQRIALIVSVCANLGLLGFFKYFNFAVESYNELAALLGFTSAAWEQTLRVVLPLGISFYTFQSMSYTIDVYRGEARPVSNLVDFACYVSMFPQLVAGPIVRFSEVADQLRSRTHTLEKFARGVSMFSLGMAKKVLVANPCGAVADAAFAADSPAALDAWFGVVAYAFQIYFDFSGYSDMAVGLGLMLGFMFAKNFDSPYRAESITDFWRRWHISLSTWLRDYLYLPLGGNRLGVRRTYVNLLLVMLLGGLWHGAAWNFVLWGAFHGALLAAERAGLGYGRLPRPLKVTATFVLVTLGWVLFRARDLPHAVEYYRSLFGLEGPGPGAPLLGGILYQPYSLLCFALAAGIVWTMPQAWDWTRRLTWVRAAVCCGLLLLALIAMETQGYNPFIYFIF